MGVDWNGFFNKLPQTLNTIGQFASSIEQFSLTSDPQWNAWKEYCNYTGDTTSIFNASMARMDNFTNAIINGQSVEQASVFCSPEVIQQVPLATPQVTPSSDTPEIPGGDNTEFEITSDKDWKELNNKYNDLSSEEKETWTTKYKDGLAKLIKPFTQKVEKHATEANDKIEKEELKKYVVELLKTLPVYKDLNTTSLEEIADKVWDNINIGDGADNLDSKEIETLLAFLDENGTLDGKITKKELIEGIKTLSNSTGNEFKTKYNKLFPKENE